MIKASDNGNAVSVENSFEPQSTPRRVGDLEPPKVQSALTTTIQANREALDPKDVEPELSAHAGLAQARREQATRATAISYFNTMRDLTTVEASVEAATIRVSAQRKIVARTLDTTLNTPEHVTKRVPLQVGWHLVPAVTQLIFNCGFFVFCLVAEFINAVSLVQNAGIGFEADRFGALALSSPFICAPLFGWKFLRYRLNGAEGTRFRAGLRRLVVPLTLLGIWLFSFKMGLLNEPVDLFSEGSEGPPLWVVIMMAMILLGVTVLILPLYIADAASVIWPVERCQNPDFLIAQQDFNKANSTLSEWHEKIAESTKRLQDLQRELATFVRRCQIYVENERERRDSIIEQCTAAILRGDQVQISSKGESQ